MAILIRTVDKKAEENFQKKTQDYYNQNTNTYHSNSNSQKTERTFDKGIPREKKKVGEYIDFEEIK